MHTRRDEVDGGGGGCRGSQAAAGHSNGTRDTGMESAESLGLLEPFLCPPAQCDEGGSPPSRGYSDPSIAPSLSCPQSPFVGPASPMGLPRGDAMCSP